MQRLFPNKQEPERLDIALAGLLGISRAQAQKKLLAAEILVNGALPSSAHILVSNKDILEVSDTVSPPLQEERALPALSILFEDADVIVLEKPSGILVHPTQLAETPGTTLMDAVLAHIPSMYLVGGDPLRSGVVHRLDREASGVLIFAKTAQAHTWLKEQFKQRNVKKYYDVLVLGHVAEPQGTITFPIARSARRGRMAARPLSQEGKEAVTHYDVVQRYSSSTLLRVRIETGRTHQIRAHVFALGHPVAGDTLYTQKKLKQSATPRLFLHAAELHITLPSGVRATFQAPLPNDLRDFLATLKASPSQTIL